MANSMVPIAEAIARQGAIRRGNQLWQIGARWIEAANAEEALLQYNTENPHATLQLSAVKGPL